MNIVHLSKACSINVKYTDKDEIITKTEVYYKSNDKSYFENALDGKIFLSKSVF